MNRRLVEIVVVAAVTLVAVFMLPGCGTLTNKGSVPDNSSPICSLANTPTDEAIFSRNEPIYWYAVDKDGIIVKYKYAVMKISDLPIDPNTGSPSVQEYIKLSRDAGFDYIGWDNTVLESGTGSSTSEKVRLFADSLCDSCRLEQVFFVVALDNMDSWSNVAYRAFFRTNHPPDTRFMPNNEAGRRARYGPFYAGTCIEGLSNSNVGSGIRMAWEGSDLIDYPGRQPDFEYEWKVYGPFDEIENFNEDAVLDTGVDYSQYTQDEYLIQSSCDEECLTTRKSATLFDLFRNEGSSDSTVVGYFVFSVRTRDDAFVADSTPANAVFKAIKPACERQILMIDDASYWLTAKGGALRGECGSCLNYGADLLTERYAPYFDSIFKEAAGYQADYYHRMWNQAKEYYPPAKEEICKYKLVVYYSEDLNPPDGAWMLRLAEFMEIGGKVMLFGPEHFGSFEGVGQSPHWINVGSIASFYFNVVGQYSTNWYTLVFGGVSNEEFAGAVALVPDVPDSLRVDWNGHLTEFMTKNTFYDSTYIVIDTSDLGVIDTTEYVYRVPMGWIWKWQQRYLYPHEPEMFIPQEPYPYVGVPGVNSYQSFGEAEALYRITSAYGEFGSQNGGLCAFRYESSLIGVSWFKSAAFSFQLYSLKDEDAIELLRSMIVWFDID